MLSLGLSVLIVITLLNRSRGPWKHLPPGPRGIPFLGNVWHIVGDKWLTFTALKEKYGQQPAKLPDTQLLTKELQAP